MIDLESVYISTWLETGVVMIADIIANNSVLVEEIQYVSTAALNWVESTIEVSVHAIPALMFGTSRFYTDPSV